MTDYNIVDIQGEPRVNSQTRGRWDFVRMVHPKSGRTIDRRYYHVDCDCITNREGHCILCGAPSPILWTI